jgi:hypothetical protein
VAHMLQICVYICAFNVLHAWSCKATIHEANTLVLPSGSGVEFLAMDAEVLGSISGTTRFSE